MADHRWFNSQDGPPDGSERESLAAVRAVADAWSWPELTPAHTCQYQLGEGRRIVEVEIPGLTCSRRFLRVMCTPDRDLSMMLESEWADNRLFDGPRDDPEALLVNGMTARLHSAASGQGAGSSASSAGRSCDGNGTVP